MKRRYKVLYVDAISAPHAKFNTSGVIDAYHEISLLRTYDYRKAAKELGKSEMNERLYACAVNYRPHFIHLGKGESIYGKTVKRIKGALPNTKIVHFYGDLRPEPPHWVVNIGKHVDYTLLQHRDKKEYRKYLNAGCQRIGYMFAGTNPKVFYPVSKVQKYSVVFMANVFGGDMTGKFHEKNRNRINLVRAIARAGIDIHIYGKNWNTLKDTEGVYLNGFVMADQYAKVCSSAKISLAWSSNKIRLYTSWPRLLNSMACGTMALTRYFPGLETVFKNKKHLVWFKTLNEASELADYYLDHADERRRIVENGRNEVLKNHTWQCRMEQIMRDYGGLE